MQKQRAVANPRWKSRPPSVAPDDELLAVRMNFTVRDQLLREDAQSFFVTPHYQSYPGVIVRLATVAQADLRESLLSGWREVAPKRLVRALDEAPNALSVR